MKKLLIAFLLAALLLPAQTLAQAQPLPEDIPIQVLMGGEDIDMTTSQPFQGGTLSANMDTVVYVKGGQVVAQSAIYTLRDDTGETVGMAKVVVDNDRAWLYAAASVYDLDIADGVFQAKNKRPITATSPGGQALSVDEGSYVTWMDAQDGVLYALTQGGGMAYTLVVLDLATGQAVYRDLPEEIRLACVYQDNKLLVQCLSMREAYDPATGRLKPPALKSFDLKTGELADLGSLSQPLDYNGAMVFDRAENALYYQAGTRVYRHEMAGGEDILCAYLPAAVNTQAAFKRLSILPGRQAAVVTESGLFHISLDPAQLPTSVLHVMRFNGSDSPHKKAVAAMRGVPVVQEEFTGNDKLLAEKLLVQTDKLDVLSLMTENNDHAKLLKKGYLADLSKSDIIMDYLDKCYPSIKQVAMADGKLYMVPYIVEFWVPSFNETLGTELGIKKPETITALLDLLTKWHQGMSDDHPDVKLWEGDGGPPVHQARTAAWTAYLASFQDDFDRFTLDTPLFRQLMTAVNQMSDKKQDAMAMAISAGGGGDDPAFARVLFKHDMVSPENWTNDKRYAAQSGGQVNQWVPLNPGLPDGTPLKLPMTVSFLAVNAQSDNQDLAIRYIEEVLKALDYNTLLMLQPGMNDAVDRPGFEKDLAQHQEFVEEVRTALEKAEGAEKSQLEEQLKTEENTLAAFEKEGRYLISAEDIAIYRDYVKDNYVTTYRQGMAFVGNVIGKTLMRFYDGQLPLEEFIKEAEGQLRLAQMEGE